MTKTTPVVGDATDNHSPGSLLRASWDAMPTTRRLTDALAALTQRRTTLVSGDEHQAVRDAIAAIDAGHPLPDDLGDQVLAARRTTERAQAEAAALNRIEDELRRRRVDAYRDEADLGLATLRPHLDAVLHRARTVFAHLDGITDPEAAIQAGVTDQWTEARQLSADYRAIRDVQMRLVGDAHREHRVGSPVEARRVSRTTEQLVSACGTIDVPEEHADPADLVATMNTSPRAGTDTVTLPWSTSDAFTDLGWVATSGATVVVPDLADLDVVADRLRALATQDAA